MRSSLLILMSIALVFSTAGVSSAFTSHANQTFNAGATTPDVPATVTVIFAATLRNISDDASAGNIVWSSITPGVTGWKAADQYIAVNGFATHSTWGIQIYTHNGAGKAGLLSAGASLPMAWRTKTTTIDATDTLENYQLNIYPTVIGGFDVLADTDPTAVPPVEYYPWFYMMDKGDWAAPGQYDAYATFIGSSGYQHAPTDYVMPASTSATYYVYLGANFTTASVNTTYSTSTLTVEMYHL